MLSKIQKTFRGFDFYTFEDRRGYECSLQKSSVATEECIWLGLDDSNPLELIPGKGWIDASAKIDKNIEFTTRMHLSQQQVKALLPQLQHFAETGDLSKTE